MCNLLKKTKAGQITIEASIIVPIVIMVMASLIYMALYTHDIITIRCKAYSLAIEKNEGEGRMPGLFVLRPQLSIKERRNQNKISIKMTGKGNTNFINKIIYGKSEEILTAQKTMNIESLYSVRALLDINQEGEN